MSWNVTLLNLFLLKDFLFGNHHSSELELPCKPLLIPIHFTNEERCQLE